MAIALADAGPLQPSEILGTTVAFVDRDTGPQSSCEGKLEKVMGERGFNHTRGKVPILAAARQLSFGGKVQHLGPFLLLSKKAGL